MEKKEDMYFGIIGIDLDRTLFSCNSFVYNFLASINFQNEKKSKHYEVPLEGAYKCSYVNKVFKLFNPEKYKAFPQAIETINSLHDLGFQIYFISSRPNIKPIISMTYEWLENHGVKYDKLVLGCKNKAGYATKENIDYFIDDLKYICEKMSEKGIQSILFAGKENKKKNKKIKDIFHGNKFKSWEDIKKYFESIINDDKSKDNEEYQEENNKSFSK